MNRAVIAALLLLALVGCAPAEQPATEGAGTPGAGAAQAETVPTSGEAVYRRHCLVCHGPNGEGNTPMASGYPYANLTDGNFAYGGSREALQKTIGQGIPGTPMRGFGQMLSEEQLTAVVGYVRQLGNQGGAAAAGE